MCSWCLVTRDLAISCTSHFSVIYTTFSYIYKWYHLPNKMYIFLEQPVSYHLSPTVSFIQTFKTICIITIKVLVHQSFDVLSLPAGIKLYNLARQLHCWEFKSEFLQSCLKKLQTALFSDSWNMTGPIDLCFEEKEAVATSRVWIWLTMAAAVWMLQSRQLQQNSTIFPY